MNFFTIFDNLRREKRISIRQFCIRYGISRRSYHNYLQNKGETVNLGFIEKVLDDFGYRLTVLPKEYQEPGDAITLYNDNGPTEQAK